MSLIKEGTEVKGKQWLKSNVARELDLLFHRQLFHRHGLNNADFQERRTNILNLIDQLDEPEVLSQELPSVPQFVAEWYEREGKRSSWWNWFYKWGRDDQTTDLETKTIKWMQDYNEEKFVDMFLHGYEVAKEQKYYVLDKEDTTLLKKSTTKVGVAKSVGTSIYNAKLWKDEEKYQLTEQEIKDYDERYWAFAKPVEELEE